MTTKRCAHPHHAHPYAIALGPCGLAPLCLHLVDQVPTISQLRILTRLRFFAHTVNAATLSSSSMLFRSLRNRLAKPKTRDYVAGSSHVSIMRSFGFFDVQGYVEELREEKRS